MKSSFYLFLILLFTGCSFKSSVYLNPPAEGVVIDTSSFEPVAGATVWFERGEPKTKTGADGRFELPPTYEIKYFRMMLPGSSFDSIPLYAEKDGLGTGIAWGHQFLNATREPDMSPIVVYLIPDNVPKKADGETCELMNEQQRAYNLIKWLMGDVNEDHLIDLKNEYTTHHTQLSEQLYNQFYSIRSQCPYPSEMEDEMFEATERLKTDNQIFR